MLRLLISVCLLYGSSACTAYSGSATIDNTKGVASPASRVLEYPIACVCNAPLRAGERTLDEYTPGSTLDTLGTTWWDWQANGTFGRAVAVDRDGFVHCVWTNSLDGAHAQRHVYYNVWDPGAAEFMSRMGSQIDATTRAGFVNVDVNNEGFAFPAFHQYTGAEPFYAAAAIDYLPRLGVFTVFEIMPRLGQVIHPRIAVDLDGNIQLACTEFPVVLPNGPVYIATGHPVFDDSLGECIEWGAGLQHAEQALDITVDIAASRQSHRLAMAWIYHAGGVENPLDVMLKISDDGGQNWNPPVNVTSLAVIDTDCVEYGGDPMICNGDTMLPYLDLSLIIDNDDNVHIAFTSHGWYYWDSDGRPIMQGYRYSNIWHWDELHREFNLVHETWYAPNTASLGAYNLMCQRPSLAIDTTTGYLYCSFQKFDSVQFGHAGFAQADAWVTASTDGGRTWAEATNVSGTDGGIDAPAGQCQSERDISLAKFVTEGTLHLTYLVDRDAGACIWEIPEGDATLNPVIYQRIPVDDISLRPTISPCRAFRSDSTGFPFDLCGDAAGERSAPPPALFVLRQNYPNPFNSATTFVYELPQPGLASLRVFDLLGREVAVLVSGFVQAGTHRTLFNGSGLASGLYFARLDAGPLSQTRKLMVLK